MRWSKREGTITPTTTITPFWYRRMCEISMLVALMIIVLYAVSTFILNEPLGSNIFVPGPVAALAAVAAIAGAASYVWAPGKGLFWTAFANYGLLLITVGTLMYMTGLTHSPYIVAWMVLMIFAGMFGWMGLVLALVLTNGALVYEFMAQSLGAQQLIVFALVGELPIAVSFVAWYHRKPTAGKTQAIDALTKQLSQVADKSEIVINAIADGVMALDANNQIQLINPAAQELLGWTKQDALGLDYRSVMKLVDGNAVELGENASPIRQVLITNQSTINNDLSIVTRSGKKISTSLVISPVGGNPATGVIVVFRDITREKEEERQKTEFISTASHEMRTPVASIEGYLALALNPSTAVIDEKARTYLLKAHEATKHLGDLFQDLLTISRAEDGRLAPKATVVDVVAVLREVIEGLEPKAKAKNMLLYFKPSGTANAEEGQRTVLPVLYAYLDQGHVREILNNLIDNAIKYTKEGSVTVDITATDTNITVSVADTGIGIPPEDVPHLFQKFYRIDNSDTREIGGTGLGLYISRRLAESNNGHLWVESEFHKGSTFYLQLPRISHEKATELMQKQPNQPIIGI